MDDLQSGLSEWDRIESVLTHPRCLNCHTVTGLPTQGDDRRPHPLEPDIDSETATPHCDSCHTPEWRMPPPALAWESEPGQPATGAAICATLTRGQDDAGPDYERLIEFAQLSTFVIGAWEPGHGPDGTSLARPPVSHEVFVDTMKRWISAGAPCPAPRASEPIRLDASAESRAPEQPTAPTIEAAPPDKPNDPAQPAIQDGGAEPAPPPQAPVEPLPTPQQRGDDAQPPAASDGSPQN